MVQETHHGDEIANVNFLYNYEARPPCYWPPRNKT